MKYNCYGQIVVNNKTKATDRLYTYAIAKNQLQNAKIGSKVLVPFGKGNKLLEGYILMISHYTDIKNLKPIKYIFDDDLKLTSKQIKLCKWLRDNYLCTYYDAIQSVVPPGTKLKKEIVYGINYETYHNYDINNFTQREIVLLNSIIKSKEITLYNLKKVVPFSIDKELIKLTKEGLIYLNENFYNEVNIKYKKIASINPNIDYSCKDFLKKIERAPKQFEILKHIISVKKIDVKILIEEKGTSLSVIKALEKKDLIKISQVEEYRTPINIDLFHKDKSIEFNDEQNKAYKIILESLVKNQFDKFLLHGITSSGKTEVYIRLVNHVLTKNQQAIILVPEISLTPQLVNKFVERFGDKVAVLHSKLSIGERYDQWRKIKNNEIPIVIGARSAVFAPCNNLGIIIIDEEHESSYKSEMHPKYHTSEVAQYRCNENNGVLLLGSATPSIDTYYKAKEKEYKLVELKRRFNNNPLPLVDIIDMREELKEGNKSMFSKKLYNSMKENLLDNKQVIFFFK